MTAPHAIDHVQGFVRFLRDLLDVRTPQTASSQPFHQYEHMKPRYSWQCSSLLDAAANYRFPIVSNPTHPAFAGLAGKQTLEANAKCLDRLQSDLKESFRRRNSADAQRAAEAIQIWGGTRRNIKAIAALNDCPDGLVEYLERCQASFGSAKPFDGQLFSRPTVLRSNAGFTKIYALLFPDFVIYDSRVAAALGMLIVRYCAQHNLARVPASLALKWMAGRMSKDPSAGTLRNPSFGRFVFARCQGSPDRASRMHIQSNLLANTVLRSALPGTRFEEAVRSDPKRFPVTPLRALEAALFMIGYDLRGNPAFGGAFY